MLKRLIAAIPVVLGVIVLIFFVTHVVPSDPARLYAGVKASPATIEAIRERLHLNDPLPIQFYYYLLSLIRGNLGYSLSLRMSVNRGVALFLPTTLGLVVLSTLWYAPLGIWLGILSATRVNKVQDIIARFSAYIGLSFPAFFLAVVLQIVFSVDLKILPTSGLLASSLNIPTHITGFYLLDSLLTGNVQGFVSSFTHLILPVFALGFGSMSLVLRMTRSTMLEILSSPFVRTLRAKGVPEGAIVRRYAFRAAMGPVLTVLALTTASLLGGTVFIEDIFGIAGFSLWTYEAILGFDYNVVIAFAMILSIVYVLTSIIVDIAYAWIEPKIRFSERGT